MKFRQRRRVVEAFKDEKTGNIQITIPGGLGISFAPDVFNEMYEAADVQMYIVPPGMSSNIAAAKYYPDSKEMFILFRSGTLYRYAEVEMSVWKTLISGPSIGRAFVTVKGSLKSYEKLAPDQAAKEF